MSILSKKKKDLYEKNQGLLVPIIGKISPEIHVAIIDLVKGASLENSLVENNILEERKRSELFFKWKNSTPNGKAAVLEAFKIASNQNKTEALRFLQTKFEAEFPPPRLKKRTSPTGYSREEIGDIITEAVEIAYPRLSKKYLKGVK